MSTPFESSTDKVSEAAKAVLTPVQRLELSRGRIRVFLDRRKSANDAEGGFSAGNVGAKVSAWADGLRANPLMGAVIDAVHGWWTTHPLHSVTLMAGDAVEDIAVPWIRRYPLAVVGGALAIGVVAAKIRPWRWLGRPALFAGLTSQIAAQLMTHAPLEFVIDAFTKFAKPKKAAPAEATPTEAAMPSTPSTPKDLAAFDPAPTTTQSSTPSMRDLASTPETVSAR